MLQTIISKKSFVDTVELLKTKYDNLSENGSFFAIFSTEYDENGNVLHDFLDIINFAVNLGYTYVNTIVYPTNEKQIVTFIDNVRYVVWLCKNHSEMTFDKDAIREKHIWKDVEWGKREKNYNPKGKDPGNVWIPTTDDGKAHITSHILLSEEEIISRLLKMSMCENNYELDLDDTSIRTLVSHSQQNLELSSNKDLNGTVIFKTAENMSNIKEKSIDVVVTSPPYWNLKDYFKEGQIGQEPYNEYLQRIKNVWSECYNKLTDQGSLWININIRVHNDQVILIPYDFVKICKELGFLYKGIIIWHKSSGIPTNNKNIVDRHEYVLIFSKSPNCCINRNILKSFSDYKNADINGSAFWNINRKAGSVGKKYIHPAIFPNDLATRVILASSRPYGIVLDPFLGSGTSLIAAIQAERNFIGYEYNEGFKELMQSRFSNELKSTVCEITYLS